jgi:hypothetical protein
MSNFWVPTFVRQPLLAALSIAWKWLRREMRSPIFLIPISRRYASSREVRCFPFANALQCFKFQRGLEVCSCTRTHLDFMFDKATNSILIWSSSMVMFSGWISDNLLVERSHIYFLRAKRPLQHSSKKGSVTKMCVLWSVVNQPSLKQ